MSFNFMAAVTIHSDFGAQENSLSLFPLFPHLFSVKWWEHTQWDWLVYGVQVCEFSHAHGCHHHRDASPPNLPSSSHHTFPPHPWPRPTPALLTLLVVQSFEACHVCVRLYSMQAFWNVFFHRAQCLGDASELSSVSKSAPSYRCAVLLRMDILQSITSLSKEHLGHLQS